ncbi:MerR family transcriptional regulator [Microbacterium sp. SA39]|uniref:MerR family transcriptional regulator n=1 Tax=Microbacterium sp. SA39 TaxID=1263625 RepID=UPI0005F9CF36|nr:MerR family transcriptional regulator [Microbacterium sp. SA39]KJQ52814.1 zinc-responsive transcriptional regulator [Microbacterium sp. SA39]
MVNPQVTSLTTAQIGSHVGYSTQQVRDLERLHVIPPAERGANGYRRYQQRHLKALRAYRAMAAAIGPVPARRLLPELLDGTVEDAAERIDDLHASLARERSRVREALRGLDVAVAESADVLGDDDAMSIGELAQALDVRTSALRHWEREGLLHPLRATASAVRSYGARAVTEARIVAALRGGGYGIPPIARILEQLGGQTLTADARRILADRLDDLTRRSVALLGAAGHLHELLRDREAAGIRRLDP